MKGGTQPIIVLLVMSLVVVPWLCLASSAAAAAAALKLKADYIKVEFSTASATAAKYQSFIASVRAGLVSTSSTSSGIPVLISEDDPLALETFLNVTLVNKAGLSVSLKMDVSGAYFSGYEAGNYSCLLKKPAGAVSAKTTVTCYQNEYPYGGPPTVTVDSDPGTAVTAWRLGDLDKAVASLFLFPTGAAGATTEDLGRGLAAIDMMVAAAATFPYVERRMSAGMWDGNGVSNDGSLRYLRESWPELSAAVQQSRQGAFSAAVFVERSNGKWMQVDNVRRAVPLVSFLEDASCKKTTTTRREEEPLLIRSVVEQQPAADEEMMMQVVGRPAADEEMMMQVVGRPACGQDEPTVRLVGLDGRCVDVPYGSYYSGKQVQLWTCKSNTADVNQLWTLKRDGTIRSNGWCLAASRSGKAGASVVIDNCPPRVPAARAVWEVRADGTVALTSGGLVLAVTSSLVKVGLTVRRDDRGTGQSWTPTNDTAPLSAAIVGYRDRCLQVDNVITGSVSVGACGNYAGVQWSIYPDGSIRPPVMLLLQQCLAADATGRVWVKYCDWAGSACERWVFQNDGTILNTGTGLVLNVVTTTSKAATAVTASSSGQVVAVPPASASASANGNGGPAPTQRWTIML